MDVEKKEEQPLRSPPLADDHSRKRKRRKRIIICSSIAAAILTLALIFLILGLTVFKAKKPVLTVDSVAIQDLNVSLNPNPLSPQLSLNLSLAIVIDIYNPNKVGVKYRSSSASLRYQGKDVGEVPIPAGSIGSDDSRQMNLTLTVFADRLLSDSQIYRDVINGNLAFTTYAKIKAKVRILFIHIHVTSTSTCDVNIDIQSRNISKQTCNYKNKI